MYDKEEFEDLEFESAVDALISFFDFLPKEKVKIIDFERYKLMVQTAVELKNILADSGLKGELDIEIREMFNIGSVKIKLDELVVMNTKQFSEMISKADNFEIYPRTDGKIQLNISFQSVLKTLPGGETL